MGRLRITIAALMLVCPYAHAEWILIPNDYLGFVDREMAESAYLNTKSLSKVGELARYELLINYNQKTISDQIKRKGPVAKSSVDLYVIDCENYTQSMAEYYGYDQTMARGKLAYSSATRSSAPQWFSLAPSMRRLYKIACRRDMFNSNTSGSAALAGDSEMINQLKRLNRNLEDKILIDLIMSD